MMTPADTMAILTPTGLLAKDRGSSRYCNSPVVSTSKSSCPSILTYPPRGSRLNE